MTALEWVVFVRTATPQNKRIGMFKRSQLTLATGLATRLKSQNIHELKTIVAKPPADWIRSYAVCFSRVFNSALVDSNALGNTEGVFDPRQFSFEAIEYLARKYSALAMILIIDAEDLSPILKGVRTTTRVLSENTALAIRRNDGLFWSEVI